MAVETRPIPKSTPQELADAVAAHAQVFGSKGRRVFDPDQCLFRYLVGARRWLGRDGGGKGLARVRATLKERLRMNREKAKGGWNDAPIGYVEGSVKIVGSKFQHEEMQTVRV